MSFEHRRHVEPDAQAFDRRESPRLEVLERVQGELRALEMPVALLNLSRGGFMMQSPIAFIVGGSHDVRFTAAGKEPILLSARVIHTMRATASGSASYMVGLEFVDTDAETQQAIDALIGLLNE